MQTAKIASIIEDTERVFKIINSTYDKSDLELVSTNVVQLDTNLCKNLPGNIKEFEDMLDVTLYKQNTYLIYLEIKPISKPFIDRYYMVFGTNKETFLKEIL